MVHASARRFVSWFESVGYLTPDLVVRDANKVEIRAAVQSLFKVTVTDVRTLVVRGKEKRVGRFAGRRPSWKKAFVTLKPGDNIEFFEGV